MTLNFDGIGLCFQSDENNLEETVRSISDSVMKLGEQFDKVGKKSAGNFSGGLDKISKSVKSVKLKDFKEKFKSTFTSENIISGINNTVDAIANLPGHIQNVQNGLSATSGVVSNFQTSLRDTFGVEQGGIIDSTLSSIVGGLEGLNGKLGEIGGENGSLAKVSSVFSAFKEGGYDAAVKKTFEAFPVTEKYLGGPVKALNSFGISMDDVASKVGSLPIGKFKGMFSKIGFKGVLKASGAIGSAILLAKNLYNHFGELKETFNDPNLTITEKFTKSFEILGEVVWDTLDDITFGLSGYLKDLFKGDISMDELMTKIKDGLNKAWEGISNFFTSIDYGELFTKLVDSFLNIFSNIWGLLFSEEDASEVESGFSGMFGKIGEFFKRFIEPLLGVIKDLFNFIKPVFPILIGYFKSIFGYIAGFVASVYKGITSIISGIISVVSGLITYFMGFADIIMGIFTLDGDLIAEGFNTVLEGIEEMFGGLSEILDGVLEIIGSAFSTVFNLVLLPFETAWEAVKTLLKDSKLAKWFKSIMKSIGKFLEPVYDIFISPFVKAWDFIIGLFKDSLIGNMFDSILSFFGSDSSSSPDGGDEEDKEKNAEKKKEELKDIEEEAKKKEEEAKRKEREEEAKRKIADITKGASSQGQTAGAVSSLSNIAPPAASIGNDEMPALIAAFQDIINTAVKSFENITKEGIALRMDINRNGLIEFMRVHDQDVFEKIKQEGYE